MVSSLCQYPVTATNTPLSSFLLELETQTGTLMDSTALLCKACKMYVSGGGTRPGVDVCPSEELCACGDVLSEVLNTTVYLTCEARVAFYDPWHRWITGFLQCLWYRP